VETPAGTAHVDQQYATGNTGFLGKPSPVTRQSSGADMVAYKVPGGAEAVAREEAESTEAEGVEEVEEEVHKV